MYAQQYNHRGPYNRKARKRYEPPVLTELGDMAELTNFDVSVRVP